ncbi:MAG: tyrosine-type recombinase/integrase [Chitinophagaceae bacterium]
MFSQTSFTVPVVCTTDPNDWYVYFEFTINGKTYERKKREGINRYKDLGERRKEAEALAEAKKQWLESGWNPVSDPDFLKRDIPTVSQLKLMGLNEALDFGLKEGEFTEETRRTYRSPIKYIKIAASDLNLSLHPVKDILKTHVKQILSQVKKSKENFSEHAQNKYAETFRAVLSVCEEWELVNFNAASKLKLHELVESDKYEAWTWEEKKTMADYTSVHHWKFFVYLMIIYHTGIRPKEILALQVPDVQLSKRNIKIVPSSKKKNSKTKKIRNVPINDHLLPLLKTLDFEKYPADHYIFGSPLPNGPRGCKLHLGVYERGIGRPDYFTPSAFRIRRDTVTKFFNKVVRKELGINKFMYGLKHTGADDNILAGIPLDALKTIYGHHSKYMTEIYAKKIKQVYRDLIITKSSGFLTDTKNSA